MSSALAGLILGLVAGYHLTLAWLDRRQEAAEYAAIEQAELEAGFEFACRYGYIGYDNRLEVFDEFLEKIP